MRKYSDKWFNSVSDKELAREREPIRIKAVYDGDPGAEELLHRFNGEEIRRMNAEYEKEHPRR